MARGNKVEVDLQVDDDDGRSRHKLGVGDSVDTTGDATVRVMGVSVETNFGTGESQPRMPGKG